MEITSIISPVACPICNAEAPHFGAVDFNKCCLEEEGIKLPPCGVSVHYHRCSRCNFLFTKAFEAWSSEDFRKHIYNDDYLKFDPAYEKERPTDKARFINELFQNQKPDIRLIDYGGGNGKLAELLRQQGYRATTYDPFTHSERPREKANLITAFEVIEHTNKPYEVLDELTSFLDPAGGLIIFSTLLQPADFDSKGLNWWYVGPRNGHIALHSASRLIFISRTRAAR